jgi:DNA-binding transcriptional LysR family regulator
MAAMALRFDLTDLRLFLTVLECGSLTQGARAILGQVEQMRGELRTYATGLKGRIRLLSNTAAMTAFLPPQLCRFLAAYPDLSIDLEERPSADIVQAMVGKRADLGIVADVTDLGTLQTHLVSSDQLVVVVSPAHRLARLTQLSFADVLDEPIVGVADTALETHLAERAARLGRQLDYRIQLRNTEHVALYVEAGIGIAIVSAAVARTFRRELVVLPLAESWAARRIYLCARDFSALTPHAALLAQQLREL